MQKIEKERVELRVPKAILENINQYQNENGISTRTAAILELLRRGLMASEQNNLRIPSKDKNIGNKERLEVRIPIAILEKIDQYQIKHKLPTRTATVLDLLRKGFAVSRQDDL